MCQGQCSLGARARGASDIVLPLRKAFVVAIKTEALLTCTEPLGDGPTFVHRAVSARPTGMEEGRHRGRMEQSGLECFGPSGNE